MIHEQKNSLQRQRTTTISRRGKSLQRTSYARGGVDPRTLVQVEPPQMAYFGLQIIGIKPTEKVKLTNGQDCGLGSGNLSQVDTASSSVQSQKESRSVERLRPATTSIRQAAAVVPNTVQPTMKAKYQKVVIASKPTPLAVMKEIKPCRSTKNCGHRCSGVKGELQCPPCLECLGTKDELCSICFTSELGSDPAIKLQCGHFFHAECVSSLMKHRWSTLRITFDFLSCPQCKTQIRLSSVQHISLLKAQHEKLTDFKSQLVEKAHKLKRKVKVDLAPISDPKSKYFGKEDVYLLAKCAFYECWECKKPFFGGLIDCERELRLETTTTKEQLLCKGCVAKRIGVGKCFCKEHGHKYITWKCCYCCSEALFKCGPTYFCNSCHGYPKLNDCGGKNCPLGVPHPPANRDPLKSMYPLGCSLCRKVNKLGNEVEEVKLVQEVVKPTAAAAAVYFAHNPLNEKVDAVKAMKKFKEEEGSNDRGLLADQEAKAREERIKKAEQLRQKTVNNNIAFRQRERQQIEQRLKRENDLRARAQDSQQK